MKRRIVFWTAFLSAAVAGAYFLQSGAVPWRTERAIRRLADKDPKKAAAAWFELDVLYYTKWAAVDVIMKHVHDPQPISFLVVRENVVGEGSRQGFLASEKPIAWGNPPPCRTVGEALMAIVYREKLFKIGIDGSWEDWWKNNEASHHKR